MDIQSLKKEAEAKFKQLEEQRQEQQNIIKQAQAKETEILTEMTKLQGEYRAYEQLEETEKPKVDVKNESKEKK